MRACLALLIGRLGRLWLAWAISRRSVARFWGGSFEVLAPYGLSDVLGFSVVAKKKLISDEVYPNKATCWRELWPELEIVDW